jgi:hypothetical protein
MDDIIKMDLKETGCGPDSSDSGYSPAVGSSEHSNEFSSSINNRKFVD